MLLQAVNFTGYRLIGRTLERDSVPAKYRQGDDLLRKSKSNFNPSTIDGCGEGAWGPQASLEDNHDNPESGTHQAPSR